LEPNFRALQQQQQQQQNDHNNRKKTNNNNTSKISTTIEKYALVHKPMTLPLRQQQAHSNTFLVHANTTATVTSGHKSRTLPVVD